MPRAKSKSGPKHGMPEFVSCNLVEEEMVYVQSHLLDDAALGDFLVKCVEASYKVSLVWDDWNDTCMCTLTCKGKAEGDPGLCLASRGPGVQEAVSVSAYKLFHKLDGDLSAAPRQVTKQAWG